MLFIDDRMDSGGGQLSLSRYLDYSSAGTHSLLVLGPAVAGAALARHDPVVIGWRKDDGFRGYISLLCQSYRNLRREKRPVVFNSLRSALLIGLLPKSEGRRILYLREDLSLASLPAGAKRMLVGRILSARFDAYVVNSDWTGRELRSLVGDREIRVAYPISGVSEARSRTPRRGETPSRVTVLSLARHQPWKGIHVLLRAVRSMQVDGLDREFEVLIAGEGVLGDTAYSEELRALAAECGSTVRFVGHHLDVRPLLDRSDILVNCSVKPEPFGQVVVQAMGSGIAVVATNHGGPREIIRNGVDGLLVEAGDVSGLADALRQLVDDDDFRESLSLRAEIAARPYCDESTCSHLEKTLVELSSSRSMPDD